MINVFIQARMNSSRFPGKVLAPFNGKPIIKHVVERVAKAVPFENIVVATSTEISDDPLVSYLKQLGVKVYRGPLDNVFERFQLCLEYHPCDWFFRVCADSPLMDDNLFNKFLEHKINNDIDIITNVFPHTSFKGNSLEMIKSETFLKIDQKNLSDEEKEHVTKVFYNNPHRFKILNIESINPGLIDTDVVVDTLDDLKRLEQKYKNYD